MKIVFCSNYMTHHQLYFSEAMLKQPNVEYKFIASEPIEEERLKNSWVDMNSMYDWIVKTYASKQELIIAKKLIKEADLVIYGSFPIELIRGRIIANKPVFRYCERMYRNEEGNISEFKTLHNYLSNLIHNRYMNYHKVYVLCSSAYTAYDFSIYKNFKGKCYKFGYFPYVTKYNIDELIGEKRKNKVVKILWVARFLKLKHPEYVIYLANRLKNEGIAFDIDMIGVGEEMDNIRTQINDMGLDDCVHLLGVMPTEDVRHHMEEANIFLFTSDYREGWGAVLNESMNSACACVSSHAIGAVPFLIDDKKNGFIYTYGNKDEFYNIVKELIRNQELREHVSREAYKTMIDEWNPENAAKRVLMLYDILINKKKITIESGVCSKAEILDNHWR